MMTSKQGETKISDVIPQVMRLASDAPEPKDLCWLVMGNEECHSCYCPECAERIVAWLRDGGEEPEFGKHEEFPTFADMDRSDNYFNREAGQEAEGCRHCDHCDHQLNVSLLEHGVESELDHFEDHGLKDADDWRHFLAVCEGIAYVEGPGFPYKWMTPDAVRNARDSYGRTLTLASKYLVALKSLNFDEKREEVKA